MSNDTPLIERIDNGIVSLRIASDPEPYLGGGTLAALAAAKETLATDATIRVLVIEGGRRYFSAGASRQALVGAEPEADLDDEIVEIPRLLLALPVPTIAAMAGHAVGGGFILGLWCDLAVLAEEGLYGANFMALGFTPGMGATALLTEAVGPPLARELLYSGRLMKGRELKAAGVPLAHAIVPRAAVRSRALALAADIAEAPREALLLLKDVISTRRRVLLEDTVGAEWAMHARLFGRDDTRNQILARYPALLSGMDSNGTAENGGGRL